MLLSPTERVFAEVRRWVEGRRYERIEAKKAAVEEVPRRLEAEAKVSSLVGWHYIRQASNALPSLLRSCVFRNVIRPSKYSCKAVRRTFGGLTLPSLLIVKV